MCDHFKRAANRVAIPHRRVHFFSHARFYYRVEAVEHDLFPVPQRQYLFEGNRRPIRGPGWCLNRRRNLTGGGAVVPRKCGGPWLRAGGQAFIQP